MLLRPFSFQEDAVDSAIFPRHDAGLSLEHNPHKRVYETVQHHTADLDDEEWVSPEQKQKAVETDCLWVLQWWPDTPVGHCLIAGADLDAVLAAAREVGA